MAITFPTTIDVLSNPTSTDLLENATAALDHDVQHSNANDAIEALEAKVGADGSAVTTSHDYKLSGVTGSDKAVSKTGTETLTNKTLTAPVINAGSDATGDIYYRSAGGLFTRLAAGATDTILAIQAGLPAWISNPSASNSSYTVKGIVQFLTDAATSGITVASGVANVNTGTGANQIVKLDSNAKLPAVDGSQLTSVTITDKSISNASVSTGNITTTQNVDTAITTTFTPNIITVYYWIKGLAGSGTATYQVGTAIWDGTTIKSNFILSNQAAAGTIANNTITVADTAPSVPGDASNMGVTMSITSLSSTGFTVRCAFTQGSTFNGCEVKFCVSATA